MTNSIENLVIPDEIITNKIYLIRGVKVMTDKDLAQLFDVKAIRLREQLKRNLEKFPSHFMFQLTIEEVEIIKKKIENQDKNIELVFSYLDELMEIKDNSKPRKPVGFKQSGQ